MTELARRSMSWLATPLLADIERRDRYAKPPLVLQRRLEASIVSQERSRSHCQIMRSSFCNESSSIAPSIISRTVFAISSTVNGLVSDVTARSRMLRCNAAFAV